MSQPQSFRASLPGLWRILQRFWPRLRQERRLLIMSLLAMLAEIGFRLLEPWPLKFIFDRVVTVNPGQGLAGVSLAAGSNTTNPAAAATGPASSDLILAIERFILQLPGAGSPQPILERLISAAIDRVPLAGAGVELFRQVLQSGVSGLAPWPLQPLLDRDVVAAATWIARSLVNASSRVLSVPGRLDPQEPLTLLTLSALAIVVISGLRAASAYANKIGLALAGTRLLTAVRSDLYAHLQRLSLSFHSKSRSGDLIVRLIGDIGRLQEVTVTAALPLLVRVLTVIAMLGLMFWLNWKLALLALAPFPLFSLRLVRLTGRIQDAARKQRQRQGAMAATATETIGAIKVVQALSLETTLERAFASQNKQSLKEGVKTRRLTAGLERTVDVVVAAGTALVLWYGARLVLRGALTPGELLVFVAYLKSAFKPMRDLAKYTGRLAKAAASGERVLAVLDTMPEIRDRPQAVPAPSFRGAIRFEGVSFAYEPGHPVLVDLNLEVQPGQQVALVGPSGAGKSTLVSLLLRFYDPDRGRVMIDGRDIRDYKLESLRTQFGIVLQDSVLFGVSARDNIAYGRLDASDEEIQAAARLANAHDFIAALPQGYDTILGERGATLSGGERQRLAIARAALRRAAIIILDEPTTGLDKENERAVLEALARLSHGRTTFTIAHDLRTIEQADLIFFLEAGRVVECGTHPQLMRLGGRYATTYTLQSMIRNSRIQPDLSRAAPSNGRSYPEVERAFSS